MTVGQRIKAARKEAGMTQKELGEKLGISFQSVAQWETGKRKPKMETLIKIAAALNTTIFELMGVQEKDGVVRFSIPPEIACMLGLPENGNGMVEGSISPGSETTNALMDYLYFGKLPEKQQTALENMKPVFGDRPDPASVNKNITFNATPDPEYATLEKKLNDGTITQDELQRYKELLAEGTANAHKAVSEAKARLNTYMDMLNDEGQKRAVERVEELTEIPKYQRTPGPPPEDD